MKTRILILITHYLPTLRRCLFNTALLFVLVAGTNAISDSVAAQGANDRYYRFEEGVAGNAATGIGSIVDSIWGSADGTPSGGPIYSSDVAMPVIPLTGEPNTLSLAFNGSQSVLFNSLFLLHRGFGDATLEFFIKAPDQAHHSIFWTRPTTDPDANRFNIAINNSGGFGFDYREPSGVLRLTPAHISLFQIPVNTWTHMAVVRDTQSSAPAHIYNFYVNGVYTTTQIDPNQNEPDPNLMWTISGRSGFQFTALIDEIRLTQRALTPEEFLIATPAPTPTPTPSPACTYNPADDFSATMNPNGSWTFGYTAILGGTLVMYDATKIGDGVNYWYRSDHFNAPFPPEVGHNPNGAFVQAGDIDWTANGFHLHPGPEGSFSLARWTANTSGMIDVNAAFSMADDGATDVHLLHNSVSIFNDVIVGRADSSSFSTVISVNAGDTIDFSVGPAGDYFDDSTALVATISTSCATPSPTPTPPEPSPSPTPTTTPTATATATAAATATATATATPTPRPTPMPFGGSCYEFVEVTYPFTGDNNSWFVAKAAAQASVFNGVNGHLVTVTSQAENDFLFSLVSGRFTGFKGAWLGGKAPEGWLDGPENGMAFTYTNWGGVEPNNMGYAYMNIGTSFAGIGPGSWADDSGVQGFPDPNLDPVIGYFVEYENACIPVTPTPTPTPNCQTSWNLGLDFSDSSNPNGPWSYNGGANPLPTYWPTWGWAFATQPNFHHIPMWNSAHDMGPDVVQCHSADFCSGIGTDLANVTWTSPITGNVALDFATWFTHFDDPLQEGRSNRWRIYHGSELLASGVIGDYYPFDTAHPATYSATISVAVGDVIRLEAQQHESSPCGTFEAFRLMLCSSETPTPTPTPTATFTPTPTPAPTTTATPTATPQAGGFVIGDLDAVVGRRVTFWGAQWRNANHVSGGSAPASFKGFANVLNPNPPMCGGVWQSDPGNSCHPPASVPAFMNVIAASSITQSGSVINGNNRKMVIIQTDPGYGPDPGHTGTGTVTAVICSQ